MIISTAILVTGILALGPATPEASQPGIRMIVVDTEAEAVLVQERLHRGEGFEDLAEETSTDVSAGYGGFLGRVAVRDLREEYQQALESLAPGETSAVTKVGGRFVLLKLLSEDETEWIELARLGIQSFLEGRYTDAENFLEAALVKAEELGPSNLKVFDSLNDLATFYLSQGRYDEAEQLFKRALSIQEDVLGPYHIDLAETPRSLSRVYLYQGRPKDVEPLLHRVVDIAESSPGLDPLEVVSALNDLARLYAETGEFEKSEELYTRALEIGVKTQGRSHPSTGVILDIFCPTLPRAKDVRGGGGSLPQRIGHLRDVSGGR